MSYKSAKKTGKHNFDTKVWWCVNHHPVVTERFSGGISINMVCKGMRKIGYCYAWSTGQELMRNGINNLGKAKEFSDMLFNEYGVFIPYVDLIGRRDVITDNMEGGEI